MLQWIMDNHGVVSAGANVLMLLVWFLYLQLFLRSYRHQLRPTVLINRGGGRTVRSRCIVTNMSTETIYIELVILKLKAGDRTVNASLSDIDRLASNAIEERPDPRSNLFQGPLENGDYLDLGTFGELMEIALSEENQQGIGVGDVTEVTITVLGYYTWSGIVAAERSFVAEMCNGEQRLKARHGSTRQITSWLERKRYKRFLEKHNSS